MLIDTHAHIDFNDFNTDRDAVLLRAAEQGISAIINVGTSIHTTKNAIHLAERYPQIFATVGIHPHEAKTFVPACMTEMTELCAHKKVVAIGEVGLDYFHMHAALDEQQYMFSQFLELSRTTGLPLIIHARDSYEDTIAMLKDYGELPIRGVMHCFSATPDILQQVLALGLHVSFAGQLTYKKNDILRECCKLVPDDRLLLETDCPFLPPQRYRGTRNEPAFLRDTAAFIAELRSGTLADVARYTTANARTLFTLPASEPETVIAYKIRNSLYINCTAQCPSSCVFCPRMVNRTVKGYDLTLATDPSEEEICAAVAAYQGQYEEICFCGFGEPLVRCDVVRAVAARLKKENPRVRLRINTNGQANLIHGRNVLPAFAGLIDKICVSLNAQNAELYHKLVQPQFSGNVYEAVKEFIREAKKYIPEVEASCLDYPGVDTDAVKRIVEEELGVAFRLRHFSELG